MRSGLIAVIAACGAAPVFHPDPEKGCADVVIAGQDDVAAAAGCRAVDSLTIRTGMALELSPLGRLESVRGALSIGPTVGLSELALPRLRSAASIRIVSNGNLGRVALAGLEHATTVEVENNGALSTLLMPKLTDVRRLSIADNRELEMLDLTSLATAFEVAITRNPKLTIIEGTLPAVESALPAPGAPAPPSD